MRQDISVEIKGEEESESIQNREVSVRLEEGYLTTREFRTVG